ncbi:hypothetical protein ACNKU7_05505 [Microbulbifer sp. SA54]|uniref:hypothetical protein n=1 Tax=Microbulbifer sp. SA54 TaxID=3401577 RepID=UPI003AB02BD7
MDREEKLIQSLHDPFEEASLQQFDLSGNDLWVPIPIYQRPPRTASATIDIFNPSDLPEGSAEGYRRLDLLVTRWAYHFVRASSPGEPLPGAMNLCIMLTHDVEPFFSGNLLDPQVLRNCLIYRGQVSEKLLLESAVEAANFMGKPAPTRSGYIFPCLDSDFSEVEINGVLFQRSIVGDGDVGLLVCEYHLAISPEHYLMFRLSPDGFLKEGGFGDTKQERQLFANRLADDAMRRIRFMPSPQLQEQKQQFQKAQTA